MVEAPEPVPIVRSSPIKSKTPDNLPTPTRERSHRSAKDKNWKDGNWKVNSALVEDDDELERARPKQHDLAEFEEWYGKVYQMTLTKALASDHRDEAEQAAEKELKQLINLKTWVYLRSADDASPSKHKRETL